MRVLRLFHKFLVDRWREFRLFFRRSAMQLEPRYDFHRIRFGKYFIVFEYLSCTGYERSVSFVFQPVFETQKPGAIVLVGGAVATFVLLIVVSIYLTFW